MSRTSVNSYDKEHLTPAQQAGIQQAKNEWNAATTQAERDAAHAKAEAIRNSAGYTSDSEGRYSGSYSSGSSSYSPPSYSAGSSGYNTSDRVSGITNSKGNAYSQTGRNITGQQVIDWARDSTDYSSLAAAAQSAAELQTWLAKRALKAEAQGINISGTANGGYKSNDEIAADWYARNGISYSPFGSASTTPATTQRFADLQLEAGKLQQTQPIQGYTLADLQDMISAYMPATPVYTPSPWDATKEALAQAALQMTYNDWTNSDQYKALANRYGHQGQLTMQDVLGQVASRTGGLASSWATTAAQQQYNEYMARLEDAAQQQYNTERGNAIQNAQLAYDFSDSDYGRYLDQLAQYNKDRSFGLDVLSQALSESHYANEWANRLQQQEYERQQDAYNRAWDEDERAYNREQAAAAASAYSPTFTQAQVITAHNDAVKNGTQLEGNMLRDYNYYMYGDPDYSGSGTTQQTTATTTPSGTTKTTTTASTSNYNGTLTKTQVKKLQEVLGVAQDGSFGPKTQAAAKKKWGTTSPEQAWQQYTYSTQSGYGGTDIANQTAMQLWELKNDQRGGASVEALANKIEAWLNNGTLTEAQAEYLLDYFGY